MKTCEGLELYPRRLKLDEAEGWDTLAELERISFPDPWSLQTLRTMASPPLGACWLVETAQGEGIAYLLVWQVVEEIQIHRIAVLPAYRGQKVAKTCLLFWFEQWRQEGYQEVTLEVREQNRPAQVLYEYLGFRLVGRRSHYYADTGEAALLLTASLTESC